jgi:hypothetical protein
MRIVTLAIALLTLVGVGYVSLEQPSRAAVFADASR